MSFQIKVEELFAKGAVGYYFRPQNWISGVYGGVMNREHQESTHNSEGYSSILPKESFLEKLNSPATKLLPDSHLALPFL